MGTSQGLTPRQVLETRRRMAPQGTIVATDVGQHQMWSIQHFHFDYPGQLLTSGGFGTMGFGLGAAIGAKVGNPDKVVVHTTGDGCFRMNCHELATVEHYHLPIITVIFNNGCLGMVRQLQDLFYGGRLNAVDIPDQPDFVKLAEAYGAEGYRVAKLEDLESTLRTAFASPNTAIIDVIVERDENVYPTVPSGASLDEMLLL